MLNREEQQQEFDKEEYLRRMNEIIRENLGFDLKIDVPAIIFGSLLITVPFLAIYYCTSSKMREKSSEVIGGRIAKHVCTDKFGKDENGMILNSAGLPKNPQTADDLPTHDITFDMLVPSPIDQHGTCGVQV
jgi:hypothetical protein